MRTPLMASLAASLLLSACGGPKALELPTDAVDRAATCGVVAAADARSATNVQQSLPFDAQLRILHHALLAATSEGGFSSETASRTSKRMSELQGAITDGDWQSLKPACAQAYPEVAKAEVALPADRFDAQFGCYSMADFLMTALQEQEANYRIELGQYRNLRGKLNQSIGPAMGRRIGSGREAQQAARQKALATMVKLGPPAEVMKQCVERYS